MSKKVPKGASFSINVHVYLPGSMKAGLANLFLISPSGCRQNFANFYLIPFPPSLFICLFVFFRHYPQFSLIHKSQLFEISARLKLVSSPFSSLQFFIGHLEKSFPESIMLFGRGNRLLPVKIIRREQNCRCVNFEPGLVWKQGLCWSADRVTVHPGTWIRRV